MNQGLIRTQFPGMGINIVFDLCTYRGARIAQERLRKEPKVGVAHLQTLHDVDDWTARGLLLPYRPVGWNQIPARYREPQDRFTVRFMLPLAHSHNKNLVAAQSAPRDHADCPKPALQNRMSWPTRATMRWAVAGPHTLRSVHQCPVTPMLE